MGLFRRRRDERAGADGETAPSDIDLRARADVEFGLPTPCPRCGNVGYVDRVDMVRETMRQHCPSCFHRWVLSRSELESGAR